MRKEGIFTMNGYRYDPHTHTAETSRCGHLYAADVVDRYIRSGFTGLVVSDGVAIDQLDSVTGDRAASGAMALEAGVDLGLWDTAFGRLEEAVSRRCQVQFQYMEYGMDKQLRPRRDRPYQVSPYGLCFANGYYYLLCRYQGGEDISSYRVDRIQAPVLLEDQPVEPLPPGLDIMRYVRERVYPFPGEAVHAVLRCESDLLSDVLDRFGMETQLRDNGDGTFDATVFTGAAGLKFWALQYVTVCQVLEPLGLRREIGEILRNGWERYETMSETVTDVRTK